MHNPTVAQKHIFKQAALSSLSIHLITVDELQVLSQWTGPERGRGREREKTEDYRRLLILRISQMQHEPKTINASGHFTAKAFLQHFQQSVSSLIEKILFHLNLHH